MKMKRFDVIIIGGGPAGIITGYTVKKQNPEKEVLMLLEEEKGLVPCGIPYIFHKLNSVDKNVMGPKSFVDAGGVVLVDPVTNTDIENKIVTLKSGQQFNYEKLVYATGSTAMVPNFIPGYDLNNVFYIKKSYNYISKLFNELQTKKNIVIVGGGFIGAEVAEQLAANEGKIVTLIESEAYCFNKAFSSKLAEIATEELGKTNVNVKASSLVVEIQGDNGRVTGIKLNSGEEIKADAVILSIGYKPNTDLAKSAGLELNKMGAIKVDAYERTSHKDVCAIGDCSQTIGFLTGKSDHIMLASTATAEARVLGYNLFGIKIKKSFYGTLGVFSTKINKLSLAAAGINENNAKEANVEFRIAQFSGVDRHPGTLPDASPLSIRLYFSPSDGTVLGGEVWGSDSAGEIINIISLAIQKSITVYELISYQIGTHPLLTSAPTMPVIIKAAEQAIDIMNAKN